MKKKSQYVIVGSGNVAYFQKEVHLCNIDNDIFLRYDIAPYQGSYCISKYNGQGWDIIYDYIQKSQYDFSSTMIAIGEHIRITEYEEELVADKYWGKKSVVKKLTTKILDSDGKVLIEGIIVFEVPPQHICLVEEKQLVYVQENYIICSTILGEELWRQYIEGKICDVKVSESMIVVVSKMIDTTQEYVHTKGCVFQQCTLLNCHGQFMLENKTFNCYTDRPCHTPKVWTDNGNVYVAYFRIQKHNAEAIFKCEAEINSSSEWTERWDNYAVVACIKKGVLEDEKKIVLHNFPVSVMIDKENIYYAIDILTKVEVYDWNIFYNQIHDLCTIKQKENKWDYLQLEYIGKDHILLWQSLDNSRMFLYHKCGKCLHEMTVEGWNMLKAIANNGVIAILYEEGKQIGTRTKFMIEVYQI